ncbi:MAG: hypothetical protein H6558_01220 [Lewinellaceae bacterium]|nr:hypothetical protein [Lewinellaceae bacterium]
MRKEYQAIKKRDKAAGNKSQETIGCNLNSFIKPCNYEKASSPLFSFLWLASYPPGYLPPADTTRLWQVITVDGNEYFGKILDRNSEELRLKTEALGVITIQVKNLKSIKEIKYELVVAGSSGRRTPIVRVTSGRPTAMDSKAERDTTRTYGFSLTRSVSE